MINYYQKIHYSEIYNIPANNFKQKIQINCYPNVKKKSWPYCWPYLWNNGIQYISDIVINIVWINIHRNVSNNLFNNQKLFQNNYLQQYKDNL
jgi:hypothetical protein